MACSYNTYSPNSITAVHYMLQCGDISQLRDAHQPLTVPPQQDRG